MDTTRVRNVAPSQLDTRLSHVSHFAPRSLSISHYLSLFLLPENRTALCTAITCRNTGPYHLCHQGANWYTRRPQYVIITGERVKYVWSER